MLSFCNYSFCMGKDVLNPLPTDVTNIKNVKIQNGIFDLINITKDTKTEFTNKKPEWNFDTIISCDFINGIGAGNVDFTLSQLTSVKIKRRKKIKEEGIVLANDFDWITIKKIPIDGVDDLNTILRDYLVPSNEEFEYAVVPILNGVEGEYITATIKTEFNGVFISDANITYKMDKNVAYNGRTSVQEVGQITPLGRKYPVIIKNGEADYDIGGVSSLFVGKTYDKTHKIDRKDVVDQIEEFLTFLKNGKPKILRDWNGLIKIICVSSNPTVNYNNNYGMGVATVSFEWVEQGKYDNENDLYDNGFIEADE